MSYFAKEQALPTSRLWVARVEPCLVIAAAPLLLFPRGFLPWVGLGLLLISWLSRGLGTGKWLIRTPLDRPIAIILLMTMVGLYASADLTLSMPKFFGILLGFFVFYATVSTVSNERRFHLALGLLAASIVAVSLLGLAGTEWLIGKYPLPPSLYRLFPRLIGQVQSSVGPSAGFNPNELGGTLAFLLPVALAMLLRMQLTWLLRIALGATVLLGFGVLALSASRSAAFAFSTVLLALLVWRWRRAGIALLSLVAVVLGLVFTSGAVDIADLLLRIDASGSVPDSIPVRLEIWNRAQYMIQDFPFTGIGLNTFPIVLDALYPTFLIDPGTRVPHAHNIFLQTAIDLGLGGLLAFLGLSAITGYVGWQAYRQARSIAGSQSLAEEESLSHSPLQAAIVGLLLGLLSYLIFGLTDTITLGAKPTVLLWLMVGLVVAAQRLSCPAREAGPTRVLPCPGRMALARRALSLVPAIMWETYWAMALILVVMGYMVAGFSLFGWTP